MLRRRGEGRECERMRPDDQQADRERAGPDVERLAGGRP